MDRITSSWLASALLYVMACSGAAGPDAYEASRGSPTEINLDDPNTAREIAIIDTLTVTSTHDDRAVLHRVASATRLSDGRFVVGNRGSHQLFMYDSAGKLLEVLAREGGGPGEFRAIGNLWWHVNDTVLVFDRYQRRVSIFAATNRSLVLASEFVFGYGASASARTEPIGRLSDGSIIAWSYTRRRREAPKEGLNRGDHVVIRSWPNGSSERVLRVSRAEERWLGPLDVDAFGLGVYGDAPFGKTTSYGFVRGHLLVFENDRFGFTEYDQDGRIVRQYRGDWVPRQITGAERSRHLDNWIARFTSQSMVMQEVKRYIRRIPVPKRMPAYRAAWTDRDGNVWIELYRFWDGENRHIVAYGPEGEVIGRVVLPYAAEVLEFGSWWIITRERSLEDLEVVVVYYLGKP
jgi:hypothetical protein